MEDSNELGSKTTDQAIQAIQNVMEEKGIAGMLHQPDANQPLPEPGTTSFSEGQKKEFAKQFGKNNRDMCAFLGMGELPAPEADVENMDDYYVRKAIFDACSGCGAAKATICRARYLKDEQAARYFAAGDYCSALSSYSVALWLLRNDDGIDYDPFTIMPSFFDDGVGDRFVGATQSAPSRREEACADGQLVDAEAERKLALAKTKYCNIELPYAEEASNLRQLLRLNIAACCLKLEEWETARLACAAVLQREPSQEKALFRIAQAHEAEGNYDEAIRSVSALLRLQPKLNMARAMLARAKAAKESADKPYKNMWRAISKSGEDGSLYSEEDQRLERERAAATRAQSDPDGLNEVKQKHHDDSVHIMAGKEEKDKLDEAFMEGLHESIKDGEQMRSELGCSEKMYDKILRLYQEGSTAAEIQDKMRTYTQEEFIEEVLAEGSSGESSAVDAACKKLGCTEEVFFALRDLRDQGQSSSQLLNIFQCIQQEKDEELRLSMTVPEAEALETLLNDCSKARSEFNDAVKKGVGIEEAKAEQYRCSVLYQKELWRLRNVIKERNSEQLDEIREKHLKMLEQFSDEAVKKRQERREDDADDVMEADKDIDLSVEHASPLDDSSLIATGPPQILRTADGETLKLTVLEPKDISSL